MNALAKVSQGRFTNSVAVRPRAAPAAPAVLQALAQSIAMLNEKVDALAQKPAQPPARIPVESRQVQTTSLATRKAQPMSSATRQTQPKSLVARVVEAIEALPAPAPRDEPRVNRRSLWDFFD